MFVMDPGVNKRNSTSDITLGNWAEVLGCKMLQVSLYKIPMPRFPPEDFLSSRSWKSKKELVHEAFLQHSPSVLEEMSLPAKNTWCC